MPAYKHKSATDSSWTPMGFHQCFGAIWSTAHALDLKVYYDADTKADPNRMIDGYTAHLERDVVKHHVTLLKRCGFKFEYSIEDEHFPCYHAGLEPDQEGRLGQMKVPAHCFSIARGAHSLLMTKFLLTTIRWISQWCDSALAFHALCADQAPATPLDTFNLLCLSTLAGNPVSPHTITCGRRLIKPMGQTLYDSIVEGKHETSAMESTIHTVEDVYDVRGPHPLHRGYGAPLLWLKEPGAYTRYMTELAKAEEGAKKLGSSKQSEIFAEALGIAA